ncbi:MAG: class I SAM-dependent DNA methyltransferase [Chloroflexota bacterium]
MSRVQELEDYAWGIADSLRGRFGRHEYGNIMLPFTVMRRLDCAFAPHRDAVTATLADMPTGMDEERKHKRILRATTGLRFWNSSHLDFAALRAQEPRHLKDALVEWISAFSPDVRDILLDRFLIIGWLTRMADKDVLWPVVDRVAQMDLRPAILGNAEMGTLFENLIRRFSEASNAVAGEHYTPRDAIRLSVDLLLIDDQAVLTRPGTVRDIYDPTCGTGGMLTVAEERIHALNPGAIVRLYGQELRDESYAICKSDMLVKGHDPAQIAVGNTLTEDAHSEKRFHYMLSNPPYGVDWKDYEAPIREEAARQGGGRFSAGLPRKSDGQLLFLQHMIDRMRDDDIGSRIAIVMNGSPLFSGAAASGESEIRRWIFESDWLEGIVGLPTQMFYNTGIQTFIWILSNRKPEKRRGLVQLINASSERFWRPMKKSLGDKRRELTQDGIDLIVQIFGDMLNGNGPFGEYSKILPITAFGYRRITVERPLRLAFDLTPAGRERVFMRPVWLALSAATRSDIERLLPSLPQAQVSDRAQFVEALRAAARQTGMKVGAKLQKDIISVMGERSPGAAICRNSAGQPEPDTWLRDDENVPLGETW